VPDASSSAGLKFTLDTVEGEPVTATAGAKVIFLPPAATRFGYREKIYLTASNLEFDTSVIKHRLEGQEAIFDDGTKRLDVNVANFNFTYKVFFENNPSFFDNVFNPDGKQAENAAVNFLSSIGRYPKELSEGRTDTIFFKFDPSVKTISKVENSFDANLVEVDFYRPDLDTFPVVTSKYFNSPNFVLLALEEHTYRVLRSQIRFFEAADDQVGIYPVKTGKQVWESLNKGRGYVVSNPTGATNIVIKKMFLAYYDPEIYQEYLQPVYVFVGEDNFIAYVPAVSDNYLVK
jgi:hypothetical protein